MLSGILQKVIETSFGQYLERINKEQLNVGLVKGVIRLRNVGVKSSALLGIMPLKIENGSIEELVATLPQYNKLSKDPVELRMKGLHLQVRIYHDHDEENARKMDHLELYEMVTVEETEEETLGGGSSSSKSSLRKRRSSFSGKLMEKMARNVHVTVDDISILLVDSNLKLEFGIKSLTSTRIGDKRIVSSSGLFIKHIQGSPIVNPTDIHIVWRDDNDKVEMECQQLSISSSPSTIRNLAELFSLLTFKSKVKSRSRPKKGPKAQPRLWWKYALLLIVEKRRPRFNIVRLLSLRTEYIHLYKLKKKTSRIKDIEAELPLTTIILYRRMAGLELGTSPEPSKKHKNWIGKGFQIAKSSLGRKSLMRMIFQIPTVEMQSLYESISDDYFANWLPGGGLAWDLKLDKFKLTLEDECGASISSLVVEDVSVCSRGAMGQVTSFHSAHIGDMSNKLVEIQQPMFFKSQPESQTLQGRLDIVRVNATSALRDFFLGLSLVTSQSGGTKSRIWDVEVNEICVSLGGIIGSLTKTTLSAEGISSMCTCTDMKLRDYRIAFEKPFVELHLEPLYLDISENPKKCLNFISSIMNYTPKFENPVKKQSSWDLESLKIVANEWELFSRDMVSSNSNLEIGFIQVSKLGTPVVQISKPLQFVKSKIQTPHVKLAFEISDMMKLKAFWTDNNNSASSGRHLEIEADMLEMLVLDMDVTLLCRPQLANNIISLSQPRLVHLSHNILWSGCENASCIKYSTSSGSFEICFVNVLFVGTLWKYFWSVVSVQQSSGLGFDLNAAFFDCVVKVPAARFITTDYNSGVSLKIGKGNMATTKLIIEDVQVSTFSKEDIRVMFCDSKLEMEFENNSIAALIHTPMTEPIKVSHEQYNIILAILDENTSARCVKVTKKPLSVETSEKVCFNFTVCLPDHLELFLHFDQFEDSHFEIEISNSVLTGLYQFSAGFLSDLEFVCRSFTIRPLSQILFYTESPKIIYKKREDVNYYDYKVNHHAVARMDPFVWKRLFFFFDGNRFFRKRFNCPVNFGPCAETERKLSNKQKTLTVSRLSVTHESGLSAETALEVSHHTDIQRRKTMQLQFTGEKLVARSRDLLREPVSFTYHASTSPQVLNSLDTNKRVSFALSDLSIDMDLSLLQLFDFHEIREHTSKLKSQFERIRRFYFQELPRNDIHAVFQISNLQFRLLSDSVPLFSVFASPFFVREVSEPISTSGRRVGTIECDFIETDMKDEKNIWCGASIRRGVGMAYYNIRTSRWEPILDAWSPECTMQKTRNLLTMEPSVSVTKLDSASMINLTMSYECCKTLHWALAKRKMKICSKLRDEIIDENCISIENKTGCDFSVSFMESDAVMVPSGSICISLKGDHSSIKIAWENPSVFQNWHDIMGISIAQVGVFVFNIYPKNYGDPTKLTRVAIELSPQEKGGLNLIVRSVFNFQNATSVPVELLLMPISSDAGDEAVSRCLGPIDPGEFLPFPLNSSACMVSIRPASSDQFEWESIFEMDQLKSCSVIIHSSNSGNGSFDANLFVDIIKSSNSSFPKNLVEMVLHPVFTISNLLPLDIFYRSGDSMGSIPSGVCCGITDCGILPTFEFRIEDSNWTQAWQPEKDRLFPAVSTVVLSNGVSCVSLFLEMSLSSSYDLVVYTTLWVINRTSLQLAYLESCPSPPVLESNPLFSVGQPVNLFENGTTGVVSHVWKDRLAYDIVNDNNSLIMDVPESCLVKTTETPSVLVQGLEVHVDNTTLTLFSCANKLIVRSEQSSWSSPCSIESIGKDDRIQMPCKHEHYEEIGVSIERAPLKFRRSRIVSLMPGTSISNWLKQPIYVAQVIETEKQISVLVQPQTMSPFLHFEKCTRFQWALSLDKSHWSSCFAMKEPVHNAIKIKNAVTGEIMVVQIEVTVEGPSCMLVLHSIESVPPIYRIRNRSSHLVHYFQSLDYPSMKSKSEENQMYPRMNCFEKGIKVQPSKRGVTQRLLSGEESAFGWDLINLDQQVLVLSFSGGKINVGCRLDELNQETRIHLVQNGVEDVIVSVLTCFDGDSKILLVMDGDNTNATDKMLAVDSERSSSFVQVYLAGICLSIVDSFPQELCLLTLGEISLDYFKYPNFDRTLELIVSWVQVDNQMETARWPIVLRPTRAAPREQPQRAGPERSMKESAMIHLSVVSKRGNLDSRRGEFIDYLGGRVAYMQVEIELAWLLLLWRLMDECKALPRLCWEKLSHRNGIHLPLRFVKKPFDMKNHLKVKRRFYIGVMDIMPLAFSLSLQTLVEDPADILNFGAREQTTGFISSDFEPRSILASLPKIPSDISNASIYIYGLGLRDTLVTKAQLIDYGLLHLNSHFRLQLVQVLGSSEIFGNPLGLVNSLGFGLRDFFYEPAVGLVESPEEFGAGLVRGTHSLIKHTTSGALDTAAKLTGAIGTGMAFLSLDKRFQAARRLDIVDAKPKHLLDGFVLVSRVANMFLIVFNLFYRER